MELIFSPFEAITITQTCNDIFSVITDFFSHSRDIYVNGSVKDIYFICPNFGKNFFTRKNSVSVFQKQFKYLKFLFCKWNFNSFHENFFIVEMDFKIFKRENFICIWLILWRFWPPQHSFHSCNYFPQGKGFRNIVVRADIKTCNFIVLRVFCCQKYDGNRSGFLVIM